MIELRKYLDWKQLALADAAGVNNRTIQRLERGKGGRDTLRKGAKALKLREEALLEPMYGPSAKERLAAGDERRAISKRSGAGRLYGPRFGPNDRS